MATDKPFSEACQRNQQPICSVLATYLTGPVRVLEIGSGTGQHGAYVCQHLPKITWQPSELAEALPGIELWRDAVALGNLLPPLALDVNRRPWLFDSKFDAVFTANTVHFVAWSTVVNLFHGAADALVGGGHFLVYGPFNDSGRYTSPGNEQLDHWLKRRDPQSGIKDRAAIIELANAVGLSHSETHSMPANNEILSFKAG